MTINQCLNLFTDSFLLVSGAGLLIVSLVLFVECVAALFPPVVLTQADNGQDKKVTVLIPAHNEENVISATLVSIKSQLAPGYQLVVIADNCDDATAEIARGFGATVIERQDLIHVGKGYALDYGLKFLESDPPDIVVLFDADCQVEPGGLEKLVDYAIATQRPVQATYLLSASSQTHPSPKESVSIFAFKVKNLVRLRGLAQLGIPCLLTGTGMAFPWKVISSVDLASGYIVEDMKLGLDLTIAGYAPVFCSEAHVTSPLPQQAQAAKSQRKRWEHGHLKTLLTYVPLLIRSSIEQRRLDLLCSALDLCVPPLSLLLVIWLMLMITSSVVGVLTLFWIPACLLAIAGCLLLSAISIAWTKFGFVDLPWQQVFMIPLYIFAKIPLYLQFLIKPQSMWVRTQRDPMQSEP